jgi:hypothetical protein
MLGELWAGVAVQKATFEYILEWNLRDLTQIYRTVDRWTDGEPAKGRCIDIDYRAQWDVYTANIFVDWRILARRGAAKSNICT